MIVCEVGPRDGLQNEKMMLEIQQKVELIERAAQAGTGIVEIGSFVHPKAVPQMADTDEVARRIKRYPGVEYRVLVVNKKGLERAGAAGIMKAKLTVSASNSHSLSNLKRTPEEVIKGFGECADYAVAHGIELSGAISTAFGCPFEGMVPLEQVMKVVSCFREMGVKELSLSDTTGMANPRQVYDYCLGVREQFPDVTWNLHFHNTRGMGLANVLAGMMAGIKRYDASFAGLGGCPYAPGATGNIATEDLVHMCHEMGIETGCDLDQSIAIGRDVQKLIGDDRGSFILKAGKCSDVVCS
ncbi:hydroxymethylglutaryl-CoA lyase [Candidatus Formimonas warabiya]|uniref:hydroxymethylglutaryl-CoA lyase n=1 Tax=Formimonas warabiya TaxID=1761012 RepID=UPI00300242CC